MCVIRIPGFGNRRFEFAFSFLIWFWICHFKLGFLISHSKSNFLLKCYSILLADTYMNIIYLFLISNRLLSVVRVLFVHGYNYKINQLTRARRHAVRACAETVVALLEHHVRKPRGGTVPRACAEFQHLVVKLKSFNFRYWVSRKETPQVVVPGSQHWEQKEACNIIITMRCYTLAPSIVIIYKYLKYLPEFPCFVLFLGLFRTFRP